ncbi:MAG: hypothetical protein IPO21_04525 [Bacteroidales bacterium]|nr:hypothetical protein [Bacteroidales bacterium]
MSVVAGGKIGVSKIVLNTPYFNGIMLADSTANWDIAKADTASTPSDTASAPLEYKISLKHFEIIDAHVNYSDFTSGTFLKVKNFDMKLNGDFSEKKTMLDNTISIEDLFLEMSKITYLNHANFAFDAKIDADMENSKFSFLDNSLKINAMELLFQGWVLLNGNDIDMDVSFGLKNTDFKELLSLIPGAYKTDFENVKTEGILSFNGNAKGKYSDSLELYPAFNLILKVADASVKYPDLPGTIKNIQLDLTIDNADGVLDNTIIDLKQLHLELNKNPFDIKLLVKTPLSDPYLNCKLIGNLELSEMKISFLLIRLNCKDK